MVDQETAYAIGYVRTLEVVIGSSEREEIVARNSFTWNHSWHHFEDDSIIHEIPEILALKIGEGPKVFRYRKILSRRLREEDRWLDVCVCIQKSAEPAPVEYVDPVKDYTPRIPFRRISRNSMEAVRYVLFETKDCETKTAYLREHVMRDGSKEDWIWGNLIEKMTQKGIHFYVNGGVLDVHTDKGCLEYSALAVCPPCDQKVNYYYVLGEGEFNREELAELLLGKT